MMISRSRLKSRGSAFLAAICRVYTSFIADLARITHNYCWNFFADQYILLWQFGCSLYLNTANI